MHSSLIIPAAGLSTRFPNTRPKWLLTHPKGNLMLVESIRGLNLDSFDAIYVTVLKEHVELYKCKRGISEAFSQLEFDLNKLHILELNERTHSQPETVCETIQAFNITGHIFIKDADDYFEAVIEKNDSVCIYSLKNLKFTNPSNKSYVITNEEGFIENIIEKEVISSDFCCGGYSFKDAKEFVKYFEQFKNISNLYVSDIIFKMLLAGKIFKTLKVNNFLDWGTAKDWNRFISTFMTIFVDLDGVLVKTSARFFPPYWGETGGIKENIAILNRLYKLGRVKIIITTSRSSQYKDKTIEQLKREGVLYDDIIFDLYHSKRIIINDYSNSTSYPTCEAINIIRNSTDLNTFLRDE